MRENELKNIVRAALFVLVLFQIVLISCKPFTAPTTNPDDASYTGSGAPPSWWGPWIRLDNAEKWYISANSLQISGSSEPWTTKSTTELTTSSRTIELDAAQTDLAKVTESGRTFYIYRAARKNASFSGEVVQQGPPGKGFSFGSALGGIDVVIQNLKNDQEKYNLKTDSNGNFLVPNAISGDQYLVTPQVTGASTVTVQVLENGIDVGAVTVANVDYNFKVTAEPADNPWLYADGSAQNVKLTITNCGTNRSLAPTYTLSSSDPRLSLGGSLINNLRSLEPATSQELTVPVTVTSVTGEYEDMAINIKLEIYNGPTWEDKAYLRFYRDNKLPVQLKSDSLYSAFASLICDDGRVWSFSGKQSLVAPYKDEGYKVVLSGATATTEVKYAIWIGSSNLNPDLNQYIPPGLNEPNDTLSQATTLYIRNLEPLVGYLQVDDIDWFNISYSDTKVGQITSISAGYSHTILLRDNSILLGMGLDNYGQLGISTTYTAGLLQIMDGVASASAGLFHSLIVKQDGSLWATGLNSSGQLGDGTTTIRSTPVKIMDGVANASAGGGHSLIVKQDGSLWATGYNGDGQFGDGTRTDRSTPVKTMDGVASASAGEYHSLIVKQDGSLWAMGFNSSGQLGDGTTTDRLTPVKIMDSVKSVAAGNYHSLIVKQDGSLWATGQNSYGQLGDGTTTDRSTPAKIMDSVKSVAAGNCHSLIVKQDGSLWATGQNSHGQLGDGTTTDRSTPVKIMDGVKSVAAGSDFCLVLMEDGTVWGMGTNGEGQLGINRSMLFLKPTWIL